MVSGVDNGSDREKLLRSIIDHFEHRLFISATPHNGDKRCFRALLSLLDPLKFPAGRPIKREFLNSVMIRRTRKQLRQSGLNTGFPKRLVTGLSVKMGPQELAVHRAFEGYSESLLKWRSCPRLRLSMSVLKRRLYSSLPAFRSTLSVHWSKEASMSQDSNFVFDRSWFDDEAKDIAEREAVSLGTLLVSELPGGVRRRYQKLRSCLDVFGESKEGKVRVLLSWIEKNLRGNGAWSGRKVLIFTEFRRTQEYLESVFRDKGWIESVGLMFGGQSGEEREELLKRFGDASSCLKILIATDAASEGLNFQGACWDLVHYEIPWNPSRMEQRNGRIDRFGQSQAEVNCYHFVGRDQRDLEYLSSAVGKIERIRRDMGEVPRLLARDIERAMIGGHRDLRSLDVDFREREGHLETYQELARLKARQKRCQNWLALGQGEIRGLVNAVLRREGVPVLRAEGGGFVLKRLPRSWVASRSRFSGEGPWLIQGSQRTRRGMHLWHPLVCDALRGLKQLRQQRQGVSFCVRKGDGQTLKFYLFAKVRWHDQEGQLIYEGFRSYPAQFGHGRLLLGPFQGYKEIPFSSLHDSASKAHIEKMGVWLKGHDIVERLVRSARDLECQFSRKRIWGQIKRRQRQSLKCHERRLLEVGQRLKELDSGQQSGQYMLWPAEDLKVLKLEVMQLKARLSEHQENVQSIRTQLEKPEGVFREDMVCVETLGLLVVVPKVRDLTKFLKTLELNQSRSLELRKIRN